MTCRVTCVLVAGFLAAGLVRAQAGDEKPSPIVKNDAAPLPAGARLQLGKLGGFRYNGRPATATLSVDGTLLAAADSRDTITIVNTQTGKIVQTLKGNAFAASNSGMTFSADNSTLAIQTFVDLTAWDVASGKQLMKVQNRDGVGTRNQGPSLSKAGKIVGAALDRFAANRMTGEVKAIEVSTGKVIGPFESIHNYNMRTAIAPDGKAMLSWGTNLTNAGFDGQGKTIQVWDLVNGKELRKLTMPVTVQAATFAPDGKSIAAIDGAGTCRLIDAETGKESRNFAGERMYVNVSLRYAPDGSRLVAYDIGGGLQAWDVAEGKRVTLVKAPRTQILGVAFPTKDRIVVLGILGSTICWWDVADAKASQFEGHLAPISALAFSPDSQTLISGGADQRVIWWDAATGKEQRQLALPQTDTRLPGIDRPNFLAISPDGTQAATHNLLSERPVQVWDLKTGKAVRDLKIRAGFTQFSLDFSPDGRKLAVGGIRARLNVWDIDTGADLFTMPQDNGMLDTRAAFSTDGKLLAVYQSDRFAQQPGQNLILWDLAAKKELRRVNIAAGNTGAGNTPAGVAFSIDSKLIAIADSQGAVLLIQTSNGREWRKLTSAARNSLPQFAFSPDGRFLAAGSAPRVAAVGAPGEESLLEIWELASGQKRAHYKGHFGGINCLAYSPDGATIATGSMDTTVLLWDVAAKNAMAAPFAEDEIPAAWRSLAGDDAEMSVILRRLVKSPGTLPFLKQHFAPAKLVVIDEKKIDKLVADLDAGSFKAREVAMVELKRVGERAEAALKKGLDANPTVEGRRRILDLLDAMIRTHVSPEELQAIRAVEVLERIATPEARAWLAAHAKGDPLARRTQEAAAALKRFERK